MQKYTSKLSETRERLINEISMLGYKQLNQKPDKKSWSIAQVCHHLVLTENLFAEAIKYGLKKKEIRDFVPQKINSISDRTKKVEAPEMSNPSSEPFQLEEVMNLLRKSRENLLAVLDTVEDVSILRKKNVKHPVFGKLPLIQWVELLYLHEQRHIEQIQDIKKMLKGVSPKENQ